MKSLLLPIALQLLAIVAILGEFLIPSMGILTIVAIGLLGYSLYEVFVNVSPAAGMWFVVADAFAVPAVLIVGFKLLVRSPLSLRTTLGKSDGVVSDFGHLDQLVGKTGIAESNCHPSGIARIDDRRIDVVAESGAYIPKNTPIVVSEVTLGQVVVRKAG